MTRKQGYLRPTFKGRGFDLRNDWGSRNHGSGNGHEGNELRDGELHCGKRKKGCWLFELVNVGIFWMIFLQLEGAYPRYIKVMKFLFAD